MVNLLLALVFVGILLWGGWIMSLLDHFLDSDIFGDDVEEKK